MSSNDGQAISTVRLIKAAIQHCENYRPGMPTTNNYNIDEKLVIVV